MREIFMGKVLALGLAALASHAELLEPFCLMGTVVALGDIDQTCRREWYNILEYDQIHKGLNKLLLSSLLQIGRGTNWKGYGTSSVCEQKVRDTRAAARVVEPRVAATNPTSSSASTWACCARSSSLTS